MPKTSKEEQNIADATFVIEELNRFITMDPRDVIRHIREHPEDAFATLRGPRGGILFCGKTAYDRFEQIADRTIKRGSAEEKTFDRRDYVRALRDAFAKVFIEGAKPVTQGSVMRFINRARELATADLVHVTHHLPCVVFYDRAPDHFSVGPVTFTTRERFLAQQEEELRRYRNSNFSAFAAGLRKRQSELSDAEVEAESAEFADKHIEGIRSYYLEYEWVASVLIPPAHGSVSQLRAERTVDAALDVLRLFVPTFPERYRRANAPKTPFHTRELMTNASGRLISAMRQGGRGAPALEGWYEGVMSDAPELWQEFERAIGRLTKGDKPDELTQRLVDALNWFGQAVVEANPAAAIVKYTAALERLTITGHVDQGLEAMVIKHVAFLNGDRTDKSAREIIDDLGKLYQMRSDLMHGSLSPYDDSVPAVLRIGWEVTRWSLLRAALVFRSLRASGKANRKDLGTVYEKSTTSDRARR
jgi:hypothetical protein